MTRDARALKVMQDRRELLNSLMLVYPNGFTFEFLVRSLMHIDPDPDNVEKDLEYFMDPQKDYVRCTNPDTFPRKKRHYKLTARGNERANRIIDDPAIDP